MGLSVTGTPGFLVQAKLSGHLPSVHDAIQALQQPGIWLHEMLAAKVLSLAGEAS
jgi:predicted nucleic acid-binding protein